VSHDEGTDLAAYFVPGHGIAQFFCGDNTKTGRAVSRGRTQNEAPSGVTGPGISDVLVFPAVAKPPIFSQFHVRKGEPELLGVLMGMTLVMALGSCGKKADAAFPAAAAQTVTTCFGRHAGAESVLTLACSDGGLVGAFGAHGEW
jgi:hypothetical protein